MWRATASLIVMISLGGIGANRAWAGSPEAAAPPRDPFHEVMAGDTLHLIAGHQYGNVRQRECLWQADPDQFPNPNRIGQGTLPRIPVTVLPPESYTDFPTRTRRVLMPISGRAGSKVWRLAEVEDQISGETPPTLESPRMEPPTRPRPGASAGPPGRPSASTGPPAYRA
jgi:hypothetical protein